MQEWAAFEQIEPFDDLRLDYNIAHVVGTLANIHRGKGKPMKPLKDFVLEWGGRPKRTWKQQLALMQLMFPDDSAAERRRVAEGMSEAGRTRR